MIQDLKVHINKLPQKYHDTVPPKHNVALACMSAITHDQKPAKSGCGTHFNS